MSLFDRVSNKEGLQEIYFVASQADSTVGSMSEVEKSRQHLPTALENAQKSLSSQLKGYADDNNYRLQLDYSLKNLIELKRFKEAMNESYQSDLNDEKLQNDLREWRDLKNTPEEENYREFEEIKKMALYFRDYYMFCLDWYDLSQEKIQEYRDLIDRRNEMLQLDYSLRNLSILKGYKERNEKAYQDYLNDEELQNDLRKWKNGDKPGFFESLFNDLFGK